MNKLDLLDGLRSLLCDNSVHELLELYNLVHEKEDEHMPSKIGDGKMLVNLS